MKLRRRPEDFIVEEDSRLAPGGRGASEGPYGLYRLRKRSITTPEDVRRVANEYIRGYRFAVIGEEDKIDRELITAN